MALVETERRYYQELVAALPVPLAVLSADLSMVWANRSFRRVFGLRTEDLRRRDIEQILPIAGLADAIRAAQTQGSAATPLALQVGGQYSRLAIVPLRGIYDSSGSDESEEETLLMLEVGIDPAAPVAPTPTGDKGTTAEVSLVVAPSVPPNLPAIIWQADAESFEFRSVAGSAEELLGYAAAHWIERAGFFEERMHPEDRAATMDLYREALAKGGDANAEFRAVSSAGQSVWCRETIRVSPAGAEGTSRLISGVLTGIGQRKQFEQQSLTASRLEAIQSLAGRLAHDLNNPLMIITGYGEEMLQSLGAAHPLHTDAAEILTATGRISALASKLTEFTRRQGSAAVPSDLGALLSGLDRQIGQAAGAGVTLEMVPALAPVWAAADTAQLSEVILTLAAGDREGAQERTRLTVTCDADRVSERIALASLPPGKYARITLRDDGHGLEMSRLAALFDPIFTSVKPADDQPSASGVALARANTLVRQWGGDIACSSEPNRGTSFSIYLPYVEPGTAPPAPPPPPEPVPEPEPEAAPAPEPLRETILVVDDEAGIRGLMRKILRRERYDVLEAASAEDALDQAAAHKGRIHLLLTDVMLPGMLGPELARNMFALDPTLKVLYISGYTQDEAVRAGEYPPGSRFLAKPFTLGALLGKVRETLDA
ncbi:MAG: response regulator [Acidobacteriota bacterium]